MEKPPSPITSLLNSGLVHLHS